MPASSIRLSIAVVSFSEAFPKTTPVSSSTTSSARIFPTSLAKSFSERDLDFDRAEKFFDDIGIGRIAECTDERGSQDLAASFLPVDVDVDQVVGVESAFEPASAIRDDAEGIDHRPFGMALLLEGNARRAVELGYDDALGAIDDECSFIGHHRDGSHVDFFFLDPRLVGQAEFDFQGDIVGNPAADALFRSIFGNPQIIGEVFENRLLIVRFDRKNLSKTSWSPIFSLSWGKRCACRN